MATVWLGYILIALPAFKEPRPPTPMFGPRKEPPTSVGEDHRIRGGVDSHAGLKEPLLLQGTGPELADRRRLSSRPPSLWRRAGEAGGGDVGRVAGLSAQWFEACVVVGAFHRIPIASRRNHPSHSAAIHRATGHRPS